jgi:hypothetical protein
MSLSIVSKGYIILNEIYGLDFRYAFLTRSAKEENLVLFSDSRTDALEKSVNMLNLNKDILSVRVEFEY